MIDETALAYEWALTLCLPLEEIFGEEWEEVEQRYPELRAGPRPAIH
jgi:hypothetical protein